MAAAQPGVPCATQAAVLQVAEVVAGAAAQHAVEVEVEAGATVPVRPVAQVGGRPLVEAAGALQADGAAQLLLAGGALLSSRTAGTCRAFVLYICIFFLLRLRPSGGPLYRSLIRANSRKQCGIAWER